MKSVSSLILGSAMSLQALTIQIDYTYDTTDFFNTQEKRNAIEAVAKFYGDLIQDDLLRIDAAQFPGSSWVARPRHPATGATLEISNLVVPAKTMIVYVGARDLGGTTRGVAGPGGWGGSASSASWFTLIRGRGSAGAANDSAAARTDFSPWGGSMTFDIDTTWNFSLSQNLAGTEFVTIALHEMGHVLGIGTSDSWRNKIASTVFTGVASTRSYGGNPPVQSGGGHFGGAVSTSRSFRSFGVNHGTTRAVLMLPVLTDNGADLVTVSDLDLAALVDIGWQISPTLVLRTLASGPAAASFDWDSSSFFDYKLQRGTDLVGFPNGSALAAGSGGFQAWADASPPLGRAFYRLSRTEVFPQPQAMVSPPQVMRGASLMTDSEESCAVAGCGANSF